MDDARIERFLVKARTCEEAANQARGHDLQLMYSEIAQQWRDLASQVRLLRERNNTTSVGSLFAGQTLAAVGQEKATRSDGL